MKILFLSSWFPYPPDTGGKIRILNLVKYLSEYYHLTFLAFSRSGKVGAEKLEAMRAYCNVLEPVVLPKPKPIIGNILPNPRWHSEEMRNKIKKALKDGDFDIVIAAEVLAGYYGAEIKGMPRILDNCELTVFIERCASEPHSLKRLLYRLEWWRKRIFTTALVRGYDACTVVSEQERGHLLNLQHGRESVVIVPNGVDVKAHLIDCDPPEPYSLVYSGALTYHANLDAMEFFLNSVFPLIKARHPQALLRITGDNSDVDLSSLPLEETSGVEFTGFLQDVRSCVAQSHVCVVPLRVGGGTRLKILEAMALGTPVVSTSKGAEGLNVTPGKNILIADSAEAFADKVCQLLEDDILRCALIDNARLLVTKQYDWRTCVRPLEALIENLVLTAQ